MFESIAKQVQWRLFLVKLAV